MPSKDIFSWYEPGRDRDLTSSYKIDNMVSGKWHIALLTLVYRIAEIALLVVVITESFILLPFVCPKTLLSIGKVV